MAVRGAARQAPVKVRGDGPAGHAEYPGGGGGVQVEQQPQRDDLALADRQPPQCRHQRAVQGRVLADGCRAVVAAQRDLPAVPPPPGHMRVQRGAHDPGTRRRMPADRKSTRLNSSHEWISYAVFCLKKKTSKIRLPSPLFKNKHSMST